MSELRHYARRGLTIETSSNVEVVDGAFDFVRCILPYNYAYTSNSQQWDEANRICQALEGPMSALGVMQIDPAKNSAADNCLAEGKQSATSARDEIIFSPPTEEEGEPISSRSQPFLAGQTDAKPSAAGDEP